MGKSDWQKVWSFFWRYVLTTIFACGVGAFIGNSLGDWRQGVLYPLIYSIGILSGLVFLALLGFIINLWNELK